MMFEADEQRKSAHHTVLSNCITPQVQQTDLFPGQRRNEPSKPSVTLTHLVQLLVVHAHCVAPPCNRLYVAYLYLGISYSEVVIGEVMPVITSLVAAKFEHLCREVLQCGRNVNSRICVEAHRRKYFRTRCLDANRVQIDRDRFREKTRVEPLLPTDFMASALPNYGEGGDMVREYHEI